MIHCRIVIPRDSGGEEGRPVKTILVIEDDEQTRGMLAEMMRRAGYDVLEAPDGRVGVELFRSRRVDLVITDILMPEKDGLETIRDLKRESPDVRIIAISGGGRTGLLDFLPVARRLGASRTFAKPTDRRELLSAVAEELAAG
ncbi:MAG: response regulator [Acidobacteria bacterium]|nr:MAG: response regulator [Acidobacteriota bacterium]